MRYSKAFNNDFNWLLSVRHIFHFDGGSLARVSRNGVQIVQYSKNGVSGKEAFYIWDSRGEVRATKHPNILNSLLRVKASINFHIKMWAEGRAEGTLPRREFCGSWGTLNHEFVNGVYTPRYGKCIALEYNLPNWVIKAVEMQKINIIKSGNFPEWFKYQAEVQKNEYLQKDFDWSVRAFIAREQAAT